MGTIKKGILGGFSGKVGTVVGANWKNISYIRSLPQNMKNPRTLGQRKQRGKFALVVALLKPLTAFLRIGWKLHARNQSPFNAAMSHVLNNAITGTFPNFEINLSKIRVSVGSLPPPLNPATSGMGRVVTITWENNSQIGTAQPTDKALIVLLNPQKGEAITVTAGAERSAGTHGAIDLPSHWASDEVHTYLGFISDNGKEVSNSLYLGKNVYA